MKKLLLTLIALSLVGCATSVPVTMKFPDAPKELLEACPDLKTVDPTTKKISDVVAVVTDNYEKYYDCKATADDWIIWYNGQKQIWNSVK